LPGYAREARGTRQGRRITAHLSVTRAERA
jgi:hypothetical protein